MDSKQKLTKISNTFDTFKKNMEQIKFLTSQNENILLTIEEFLLNCSEENENELEDESNYVEYGPKSYPISIELAQFFGMGMGAKMTERDAGEKIVKYIQINNLQDKDNFFKINPNETLTWLLKLNPTDELTFFNLQRYMSPHFDKKTSN